MLKRWMSLGLLAIGVGHVLPASAQVQPHYFGKTRLVNAEWTAQKGPTGGQCIDVPYGTKAIGTVLQMFRCHDDPATNQAFVLKDGAFENSRIAVYDGNDERCLGFEDEGGKVNITQCASAPRWTMTDRGQIATPDRQYCIRIPDSGYLELTASCNPGGSPDARTVFGSEWQLSTLERAKGRYVLANLEYADCLDVRGASMAPGASLMRHDCHFGENQTFELLANSANQLFFTVYANGRKLCIANVRGGGGDWSQAVPCNQWDPRAAWGILPGQPGFHVFVNAATGRCLDAYKRDPVGAWECHGGLNQQWLPFEI